MFPKFDRRDVLVHELESRLRADACRLATTRPTPDLVSALVSEHERRRQVGRARRRTLMMAVGSVLVLGASLAVRQFGLVNVEVVRTDASPLAETLEVARNLKSTLNGNSQSGSGKSAAGFDSTEPLASEAKATNELPSAEPVPVWIVTIDANGQSITVPGVYVPGQMQTVPLDELSPPIRRAARMLLGMEEPESDLDAI